MKERAQRVLATVENDLLAAKRRRDEIGNAIAMLANAGVADDLLNPLHYEYEQAKEEVTDELTHRMLIRAGMREHCWLDA